MKTPDLNQRTKREALLEGARVLEALAAVYDGEPEHRKTWQRRAAEARRYARALRKMAAAA
jgi:hypothetical protein